MGSRNPERIWPTVSFQTALTLGDIRRAGWRVRARCHHCRALMAIDVDQRIRVMGEFAILWGRRGRCPMLIGADHDPCPGQLVFEVSGSEAAPFRPMIQLPAEDYLRRYGRRVYDGNSDVVIW